MAKLILSMVSGAFGLGKLRLGAFAQRGFKVWLLEGGLRSVQKSA